MRSLFIQSGPVCTVRSILNIFKIVTGQKRVIWNDNPTTWRWRFLLHFAHFDIISLSAGGVCSHYNLSKAPEVWNRKVSVIVWFNAARWHIQRVSSSVALSFPAGLFTCGRGHWSCMIAGFLQCNDLGGRESLARYENLLVSCRNVFLYKWKGLASVRQICNPPSITPKAVPLPAVSDFVHRYKKKQLYWNLWRSARS